MCMCVCVCVCVCVRVSDAGAEALTLWRTTYSLLGNCTEKVFCLGPPLVLV